MRWMEKNRQIKVKPEVFKKNCPSALRKVSAVTKKEFLGLREEFVQDLIGLFNLYGLSLLRT